MSDTTLRKIIAIALVVAFAAYGIGTFNENINDTPSTDIPDTQSVGLNINETPARAHYDIVDMTIFEGLTILWDDGYIQYAWGFENGYAVLYVIKNNGSEIETLAAFPPSPLPDWASWDPFRNYVYDFGIADDWIILSVGFHDGSARVFHGDFVRMRKDGSQPEHFWLTDDSRFFIIGDWIYYNRWAIQPCQFDAPFGAHRIRPDGTDKEYLGNTISRILLVGEDGYVYGIYREPDSCNLIRWNPCSGNSVELFRGGSLPQIEGTSTVYSDITITYEYILFTAHAWGYDGIFAWRGGSLYTASYRVGKDGNNLILLREMNFCQETGGLWNIRFLM